MQVGKSIVVMFLIPALCLSPLQAQFQDVPEDSWYEEAVLDLHKWGIVKGYEVPDRDIPEFRPFETVTRAEFLKMCLLTLLHSEAKDSLFENFIPSLPPFPDVPTEAWHSGYVDHAKKLGIIEHTQATFLPDEPISRGDAARWVFGTLGLFSNLKQVRIYSGFLDVEEEDSAIIELYKAGIVDGFRDLRFRPENVLTRAEAVVLIHRADGVRISPRQLNLQLVAHTPLNPYLEELEVPDSRRIVGIRLNQPDHANNFIRVRGSVRVPSFSEGLEYYLRLNKPGFRIWEGADKTSPLLIDGTGEEKVQKGNFEFWVENVTNGFTDLYLEARNAAGGEVICSTQLRLETFKSMVIVLGGRGQEPANYDPRNGSTCSDKLCGIFDIGLRLHQKGFDVRLFNENKVAGLLTLPSLQGSGEAYDEIEEAVESREVTEISIIGYSYGGGSTWGLVKYLDANLNGFSITYTAYIDAIVDSHINGERGIPCSSLFHDNHYQNLFFQLLDGKRLRKNKCGEEGPKLYQKDVNKKLPEGQSPLDHFNIDDSDTVQNSIVYRLTCRVARTASDYPCPFQ